MPDSRVAQRGLFGFSDAICTILNAETKDQIADGLRAASTALGFETFNISYDKRHTEEFMTQADITSWKQEDISQYVQNGYLKIDPLLVYVARASEPLTWTPETIRDFNSPKYHEMIRTIGIQRGATVPLPAPEGSFSAITFLSSRPLHVSPVTVSELSRTVGIAVLSRLDHLGIMPVHATPVSSLLGDLSDKQRNILQLVALGKTNAEISVILDLPRKQVDYHISWALLQNSAASGDFPFPF